jgi:hypothetical protein
MVLGFCLHFNASWDKCFIFLKIQPFVALKSSKRFRARTKAGDTYVASLPIGLGRRQAAISAAKHPMPA